MTLRKYFGRRYVWGNLFCFVLFRIRWVCGDGELKENVFYSGIEGIDGYVVLGVIYKWIIWLVEIGNFGNISDFNF